MRTDTLNPVLATMLEYMHITENRYSGIPIMRKLCQKPQSKKELAEALGLTSVQYAFNTYVKPMLDKGLLKLTIPEAPNSRKQKYAANIKV